MSDTSALEQALVSWRAQTRGATKYLDGWQPGLSRVVDQIAEASFRAGWDAAAKELTTTVEVRA